MIGMDIDMCVHVALTWLLLSSELSMAIVFGLSQILFP